MAEDTSPFSPYQSQVLFLLIGTNPLPNYVAACLLAAQRATVYLLCTEKQAGTYAVAQRLRDRIQARRADLTLHIREIHSSEGDKIFNKVTEILVGLGPGISCGLNYSGGTKPMAVHAYEAIKKRYPSACFSYLDARSLKMLVRQSDQPAQHIHAGAAPQLKLLDLFDLHGYKPTSSPVRRVAREPSLCAAILRVFENPAARKQWMEWVQILDKTQVGPEPAQYPLLAPVWKALSANNLLFSPTELAQHLGQATLHSCRLFLISRWLEEYTLESVRQASGKVPLSDYGIDLELLPCNEEVTSRPSALQIDVAAISGYQLFAISCATTDDRQEAKDKLMEIYVRARQIGGDEARLGLVCRVANPGSLQDELEQDWDAAGRIRVFGRADLARLSDEIAEWIKTANG